MPTWDHRCEGVAGVSCETAIALFVAKIGGDNRYIGCVLPRGVEVRVIADGRGHVHLDGGERHERAGLERFVAPQRRVAA